MKQTIYSDDSHHLQSQLQKTPIAIIGMASIFPDAPDLETYWHNILHEVDSITDVPQSRWQLETYYDPDPTTPDKTYCKRGAFIPDIEFDPIEFGIPPNVLEATDVSQLLALVVAKEALRDAGYISDAADTDLSQTGVVLGVAVGRQLGIPLGNRLQYPIWKRVLQNAGLPDDEADQIVARIKDAYVGWEENSFPGLLGNVVAGRIANRLNLGGLNCVVDAACASSLGAVKMAISELLEGRSDMMITGGVDTDNSIMMYMCFSKTPAFTQHDHLRPFDADSDGMMVGEGIGMLVLKRLADAERDNDRIYAVIRGIGTSSDGRFKSIYAPRPQGQLLALQRAYADAGFSANSVHLIEAHGTGTGTGDPTEIAALTELLQANQAAPQQTALGSVKSQIGHTKAAAGAASLIKTALALHHHILPATINVKTPRSELTTPTSPLYLNSKNRPWFTPGSRTPRRAGVSSFGFGGTNFHLVLEAYDEPDRTPPLRQHLHPIILHAETAQQLLQDARATLEGLQTAVNDQQYDALIAATQTAQIPATAARLGFVATSTAEATARLQTAVSQLQANLDATAWSLPQGIYYRRQAVAAGDRVVALFPGQGAQYVDMARQAALYLPPLRQNISQLDQQFVAADELPLSATIYPVPAFSPAAKAAQKAQLQRTDYAQPAIGAISAGFYEALRQLGFRADFTAGHSFGELTALWAAGVFSDRDYLRLIKVRGAAMATGHTAGDAGSMIAVKAAAATLTAEITRFPDIVIANQNAPQQTVLAGPTATVRQLQDHLSEKGYSVFALPVAAAFHTSLVGHAQRPFAAQLAQTTFQPAQIPVYANATAQPYPADPAAMRQQLADQILNPVLFQQQIENIYAAGGRIFVEIGPKNVLTNLVKQILGERVHETITVNSSPQKDSNRQYMEAILQCLVLGLPLQLPVSKNDTTAGQKKRLLTVTLNGSNHLSKETVARREAALNTQYELPALAHDAAAAAAIPAHANDSNHNRTDHHNGHTNDSDRPAAKTAVSPTPMNQYLEQQQTNLKLHEQYLANEATYLETLMALMQQQQSLLARQPTPEMVQLLQTALDTLAKAVAGLNTHQSETMRAHEQFLARQDSLAAAPAAPPQLRESAEMPVPENISPPTQSPAPAVTNSNGHHHGNGNSLPAAAATAPAATIDVAAVSATLMQIVSDKTGYPLEVLAPEMDMESDLGIDSIKRVEILGAMQTQFPELPQPDQALLAELRTLGQVVDFIETELQTGSTVTEVEAEAVVPAVAPPAAPTPTPLIAAPETAVSMPSASPATEQAIDVAAVSATLMQIVSDKTGYPLEVLAPEMDMESDLGIDSIKRVEILGAMQTQFPELPQPDQALLAELRTLGQVVDFIETELQTGSTVTEVEAEAVVPAIAPPTATPVPDPEILAALLTAVSIQTGLPQSALSPEMHIHSDLGLDRVMMVEIVHKMRASLPSLPTVSPDRLFAQETLADVAAAFPPIGARTNANGRLALQLDHPKIKRQTVALAPIAPPDFLQIDHQANGLILVTAAGHLATDNLLQTLVGGGAQVLLLQFPDVTETAVPAGVETVRLPDWTEEALAEQLMFIRRSKQPITGVIHLHPFHTQHDRQIVRHIFLLAKHLKEVLADRKGRARTAFMTVVQLDGQLGLSGSFDSSPLGGSLFGLVKSINLEWPSVYCRALDLAPQLPKTAVADIIWRELHDPNRQLVEAAYDGQQRLTPQTTSAVATSTIADPITSDSCFLVSGGARGITAACVRRLAAQFHSQFVLLGRTPLPDAEPDWAAGCTDEAELKKRILQQLQSTQEQVVPLDVQRRYRTLSAQREIRQTLQAVADAGGSAIYLAADITQPDFAEKLAATMRGKGPITGVIHGAGVLADKWIDKKTAADFEKVFATKVDGLQQLLAAVDSSALQHLILFSSTAGFYGNVGQSDYAMANEALNKLALQQNGRLPNCRVVAINWGPWDGGMVTPTLKRIFASQNIALIPLELGTGLLLQELCQPPQAPAQIVVGSPLVKTALAQSFSPGAPANMAQVQLSRQLNLQNSPFMVDHAIDGRYVLPFTCAAGWMINVAEQLTPGYYFTEWQEMRVLKGIILDELQDEKLLLDLEREESQGTDNVVYAATIWSNNQAGKVRYHYRGQIVLQRRPLPPTHYVNFNAASNEPISGPDLYRDGTLFHGKSFQGIAAVLNLDSNKVTSGCVLPAISPQDQGQFAATASYNPFVTDVYLHNALIFSQHMAAKGCLPTRIGKLEQFSTVDFDQFFYVSMELLGQTETSLHAQFIIHDKQGNVLCKLSDCEFTVSSTLRSQFKRQ